MLHQCRIPMVPMECIALGSYLHTSLHRAEGSTAYRMLEQQQGTKWLAENALSAEPG